jgi:hypothetical protein
VIIILTWFAGIVFSYYVLKMVFGVMVILIGSIFDAVAIRKRNKRARRAFENDPADDYKPEFKFRYLLPRKK